MSATVDKNSNRWVAFSNPPAEPVARLICFPYAGGGASAYRKWQTLLGSDIEVCPVQLPGREGRFGEEAYTDIEALMTAMVPELRPLFDRPVFLFGYSMGAAIAYKVASYCSKNEVQVDLRGLICCARQAPARESSHDALRDLSDDEFLEHIVSLGGATELNFQHAELRRIAVRLLRSDFLLSASVVEPHDKVIDVPLTVIGGANDKTVSVVELEEWRRVTNRRYRRVVLPGGHFFVNEDRDRFMTVLKGALGLRIDSDVNRATFEATI
jgi:medium-chain acyl-[acyl-carrier-protein] hydrolase